VQFVCKHGARKIKLFPGLPYNLRRNLWFRSPFHSVGFQGDLTGEMLIDLFYSLNQLIEKYTFFDLFHTSTSFLRYSFSFDVRFDASFLP
jgi:hypothetical protein